MFFGGLNGDGFFNEEYCDGGYESGEGGYSYWTDSDYADEYSPAQTKSLKKYDIKFSGKSTDKALQFKYSRDSEYGYIWLPRSAVTQNNKRIYKWAIKLLLLPNLEKMVVQEKLKNPFL